jgi:hypothetical protein
MRLAAMRFPRLHLVLTVIALGGALTMLDSDIDALGKERRSGHADSAPVSIPAPNVVAQSGHEAVKRALKAKGFREISGLVRRGENVVAQATDRFGMRVRIVLNTRTGDIVGLSEVFPKK